MIENEEWFDKYYYYQLEPINGLQLFRIYIKHKIYIISLCDGMNGIPYIEISTPYTDHTDVVYRINMDDGSNYQVGDENHTIDPYILEVVRTLFLMKSDREMFYEPYMKDKSPEDFAPFDFNKSIWYNSIIWLNISYENKRDPNKPIVF